MPGRQPTAECPQIAALFLAPPTHPASLRLQGLLDTAAVLAREDAPLVLVATEDGLELRCEEAGAPGPLRIDFTAAAARRRLETKRSDPLARALGMRRAPPGSVLDATCGMGRDTLALLGLGCQVHALERNPIVAALLQDALARAAQDAAMGPLLSTRLRLTHADALAYLGSLRDEERPDVVFLDPMYAPGKRRALPGGATQILQRLVAPDDAEADRALLSAARAAARQRVVVKRARKAPPLEANPRSSHGARATRYDVYAPTEGPETGP